MLLSFPQNKNFFPKKFEPFSNSPLSFLSPIRSLFPLLTQQPLHLRQTDHPLDVSSHDSHSPKRVAVVFSGGPAPGGHNVIAALYDSLHQAHFELLGVLGGPKGLLEGRFIDITLSHRNQYINTGGFSLLGTDRTKISHPSQFEQVRSLCIQNRISALVIIGGDDSNTNAAFLAEALAPQKICVVGVPKTIDGDLQAGGFLPISFGFDTATKVYIETVGNLICEAQSSKKHWHFIKLMGRSASHITLEVALQTYPHIVLISEEIWHKNLSVFQMIQNLSQEIALRAQHGFPYGVVLIPEGIFERIHPLDPHLQQFLSFDSSQKDQHGNFPWSRIQTEILLSRAVESYILQNFSSLKLSFISHFLGYEARCAMPSLFDLAYTYFLGQIAANLILQNATGYLACVSDLDGLGTLHAISIPALFSQEMRQNQNSWVFQKALVSLDSPAFQQLSLHRLRNLLQDPSQSIPPRQYHPLSKAPLPVSVVLNQRYVKNYSDILDRFL